MLDPVCGMTVDPHSAKHRHDHKGHTYYFCSAGCRTKFARRPGQISVAARAQGRAGAGRHDLHLPDASGDPAGRSGLLPDLRHGAGARHRDRRSGPNPELADMTRRFWIGACPDAAGLALAMGHHLAGGHGWSRRAYPTGFSCAGNARRALGRLAVLRARLAIAGHPQPQHVHADRDRHRRRLSLQPGRDARARALSRRHFAAMTARSRSISKRPP